MGSTIHRVCCLVCLNSVSKSVEVVFDGIEAVVVPTLMIPPHDP